MRIADRTLLDYIADTAQQQPNHPALLFKARSVTYEALARRSDAFATALVDMGVPGDRRVRRTAG